MGYPTKIATCCYCGTRAALTLDRGRHELSCARCAAPLHDLKALPVADVRPKPAVSHLPGLRQFPVARKAAEKASRKPRKVKPRKSLFRRMAEEAFDVVEDIFD
ncbi:hypothetical protein A8B82_10970 [Sulfitobacter sp. EhC04]|uniref:hypothetical protein n=1 Tax=Sulfitobacter sp. EhC04 TaxID=1849168 RepID=UPI0007F392F7|nr:hypothetical protein [Sulfitobacter sp. EhC04]OAN78250.1 hypothetical protein A8B82_10970 [Sulfitobacter sp. EhC04]